MTLPYNLPLDYLKYGLAPAPEDTVKPPPAEPPKVNASFLTGGQPEPVYTSDRKPPSVKDKTEFVLDFIEKNGRAPYQVEINDWTQTFSPQMTDQYKPGSVMYEMGFRTIQEYDTAQKKGETYGPHSGSSVPEGSIVVTDASGNPAFRTYDLEKYRWAMDSGRYIDPRSEKAAEYYPVYDTEKKIPGDANGIMSAVYSPTSIYSAKLEDYLNQNFDYETNTFDKLDKYYEEQFDTLDKNYAETKAEVNKNSQQYNQEQLDQVLDKLLLDYLDVQKKLQDEYSNRFDMMKNITKAQDALKSGMPPDQLPIYADLQNVMGDSTNQILNNALNILNSQEENRIKKIPEFKGYSQGKAVEPTGNELQDYLNWLNGRKLAPEYRKSLANRFSELYQKWKSSGMKTSFLEWVKTQV